MISKYDLKLNIKSNEKGQNTNNLSYSFMVSGRQVDILLAQKETAKLKQIKRGLGGNACLLFYFF